MLKRPETLELARAEEGDIDVVLDQLAGLCIPVELHFLWRPTSRDPDDDMVLETAINGRADAIVSFNIRHLAAAGGFGIAVMQPGDLVRRLSL